MTNGYLLYDDDGRPFYYVNRAVAWVPATSPRTTGREIAAIASTVIADDRASLA